MSEEKDIEHSGVPGSGRTYNALMKIKDDIDAIFIVSNNHMVRLLTKIHNPKCKILAMPKVDKLRGLKISKIVIDHYVQELAIGETKKAIAHKEYIKELTALTEVVR